MSRILAIDYGIKRVGIAVTDELQIIASALTTVAANELIAFLKNYTAREDVETILVGEPKKLDLKQTHASEIVDKFVTTLKNNFKNIDIVKYDERFTSKMAFQTMIESGISKKARQNKELIDAISATILLQSYLEYKNNQNNHNIK